MAYEDTIRRVVAPQELVRQDGIRKVGDDEFTFVKDPPDLQPFEVYRELTVLATDTADADDTDLAFGPAIDVEAYRTVAVAWILADTAANAAAGILVPQAQLKLQRGSGELPGAVGIPTSWDNVWFAPAVVDSVLTAGLNPGHDYREVNPAEFRMAFERPSGETAGQSLVKTVLQFDVTPYAYFRLGVGVDTGSTGMLHGLLTSLIR